MRKLSHIEIIEDIQPIPGADRIQVATVLGWKCVIKKDEFKVGDKIIYVEVDSVLPDKPEFEFLRDRKFRIRTIKLKGQVSQGLILPIYPTLVGESYHGDPRFEVGTDVTEKLGIVKYISPSERNEIEQQERKIQNEKNKLKKFMMRYSWFRKLFLSRKQKSGFPNWVSKTDEQRVQNIPTLIKQNQDVEVYVTEKIDYQSATFTGKMVKKYSGLLGKIIPSKKYLFVVCSRNLVNNDKGSLYHKIAKKYNIEDILRENPNLTIQGEQGSPSVQGNKYGINNERFWVFNVIDHVNNYHYDYDEMVDFCKKYNLEPVYLIGKMKLSELGTNVDEIVEKSRGQSVYAKIHREGIVIRSIKNGNKNFSFKAINPDFLLKYDH